MGVVDTLKSMMASDTEQTTKVYVCRDCNAEFESDDHPMDVTCTECGSEYVYRPE